MEFSEVVKKRYSCKKFDGRKVEKEKINEILEAGRLAPTAKNLQEQKIYVLESEEMLAKVDKLTPCRYGASVVLVVAFDKNNVFTYPGEKRDSGVEDATIVATHMMLAATNVGVDSCWINFFNPDDAKKLHKDNPDNTKEAHDVQKPVKSAASQNDSSAVTRELNKINKTIHRVFLSD